MRIDYNGANASASTWTIVHCLTPQQTLRFRARVSAALRVLRTGRVSS